MQFSMFTGLESLEHRTLLTGIAGGIYDDHNYSGTHDGNELSASAATTVYLDANNNGQLDSGETSTVSTNGNYFFAAVPNGTYTVRAIAASGYVITSPVNNGALTVTVSDQPQFVAAGDFGTAATPAAGSISGVLYSDNDASGNISAGDSFGTFGSVFLDLNSDGVRETSEPRAAIANNYGEFTFANLPAGTYTVRGSSGAYALTSPSSQAYTVSISGQSASLVAPPYRTGLAFGFTKSAQSANVYFFNDLNRNGKFDSGENYLPSGAGAYADLNNDGIRESSEPVVLDNDSTAVFSGLPTGTYAIRGFGGTDYTPTTAGTTITLPSPAYPAIQLGFIGSGAASVSGTVFRDDNNNGMKDAAETGINGVSNSVRVYVDANNDGAYESTETSTFADSAGNYTLSGAPGAAVVRIVLPSAQFVQSYPNNNAGLSVTLVAGSTVSGQNFGIVQYGTISGLVGNDANGDGTLDNGETGLANVVVYIDANANGQYDYGEKSVGTGSNGYYVFGNLLPGTYLVRQIVPSTYRQIIPYTPAYSLSVAGGANVAYFYDRNTGGASISGTAYNDANSNGTQDGVEGGWQGITVWDDTDNDGQIDSNEQEATTDSSGSYTLSGLPAGTYHLRALFFSDQTQTSPGAAGNTVTVSANQAKAGINFGGQSSTPTFISGYVFNDANSNGVKDSGETGISGVNVFFDSNKNGVFDGNDIVWQTDAAGYWSYWSLPINSGAGPIRIAFYNQTGRSLTTAAYVDVTPHAGQQVANVNFGVAPVATPPVDPKTGSISGTTFNDTNGNGTLDAGETLGSGKTIFLDANNNGAPDSGEKSLVTGSSGAWSFTGLAAGTYHVRRVFPSGYVASTAPIDLTLTAGQAIAGQAIGSKSTSVALPPTPPATDPASDTLEAEAATLSGGAVVATKHAGYTGSGYVTSSYSGAALQWTTTRAAAGAVTLTFRYANGDSKARPFTVMINGVTVGTVAGAPNGSYDTWTTAAIDVSLAAGSNAIKVVSGAALGVNFDNVIIAAKSSTPPATTASLSGFAFNDTNKNGALDSGEVKTSGKTVFLDANNNGTLDGGEKSVVTDSTGAFNFTGLAAGTYHVRRVFPSGYTYSTALIDLTIAAGQTVANLVIGSKSTN